jgi:hypothetical protein
LSLFGSKEVVAFATMTGAFATMTGGCFRSAIRLKQKLEQRFSYVAFSLNFAAQFIRKG